MKSFMIRVEYVLYLHRIIMNKQEIKKDIYKLAEVKKELKRRMKVTTTEYNELRKEILAKYWVRRVSDLYDLL